MNREEGLERAWIALSCFRRASGEEGRYLDADVGGEGGVDSCEIFADLLVGLLRLLGSGNFAGSDGPDRLIGDDNGGGIKEGLDRLKLRDANLLGLVGLALRK